MGKYLVETPTGRSILHFDSFKPYQEDLKGSSIPFHYYQPVVPKEFTDSYVVDKIIEHKVVGGQLQCLVKWRGYEDCTWEPAFSFVGDVQEDWMKYCMDKKLRVEMTDLNK